jgi:hypothetical protein
MELGGIHPAWEKDQWQSLVNTVMNLRLSQKERVFLNYQRNN